MTNTVLAYQKVTPIELQIFRYPQSSISLKSKKLIDTHLSIVVLFSNAWDSNSTPAFTQHPATQRAYKPLRHDLMGVFAYNSISNAQTITDIKNRSRQIVVILSEKVALM